MLFYFLIHFVCVYMYLLLLYHICTTKIYSASSFNGHITHIFSHLFSHSDKKIISCISNIKLITLQY
ncbi:hypothetical protein GLOIN_2v1651614 [Rhizophagus irregularis DAOM 181602=DAOM 197198]|uniref:Uncharacterized protein n=1 Tax=Rhizophagus irregularis (strain DAOM 181602 / DAOM 197198 / MUCL 43194) TaxID=747089 RepID=U9TER9_RHIID|nr:hypothetical protein GLOIN_2v1651614 [Rhizophagus irregularis DAOM 181602=DAOM 197198]POG67007.1 hypothetical protein GLOIN_2v1651614 [Rhizophagus irregularis DAOM 181602=DAOM 197198]GBC35956.1 hypothetical protein GLOIN_2v1651614 [Rhizophagus irregularis DAOM 181602=DAOM 197198]|eukprot:XP_025173873.1 hypothetical protein GLOIN_2v1651614 [Rhizophagus irregularis DAOM 181602=DAOM 197198]